MTDLERCLAGDYAEDAKKKWNTNAPQERQ